jgi:predicted anti-sigma-YlaC factor YlaD
MRESTAGALLCERTREWISLELDGELSEFEGALMHAHLACCFECREFETEISAITTQLRAEALEALPGRVALPRIRRRPLRTVQVAAAAAVVFAAAGLGSILGSLQLGGNTASGQDTFVAAGTPGDPLLRDIRIAFLKPGAPAELGESKPPLVSL